MSHSVVKVTDAIENDSLLLLVGEDGTVTPDKETVKTFLKSKGGSTNIQLMHINKSDGRSIDVSIDNLTYVPDDVVEEVSSTPRGNMDRLAHNLYSIRLDHDYTSLTSPKRSLQLEDPQLAETLGILEGTIDTDPPALIIPTTSVKTTKIVRSIPKQTITIINKQAVPPLLTKQVGPPVLTKQVGPPVLAKQTLTKAPAVAVPPVLTPIVDAVQAPVLKPVAPPLITIGKTVKPLVTVVSSVALATSSAVPITTLTSPVTAVVSSPPALTRQKPKVITTPKPTKPPPRQVKTRSKIVEELSDEDDFDGFVDDINFVYSDDDNDSDFDIVEAQKQKPPKRVSLRKAKKAETVKAAPKSPKAAAPKTKVEKQPDPEPSKVEKPPDQPPPEEKPELPVVTEQKPQVLEKKPPKKEKKPPKPMPDDFALFSTPHIIRRVGGKEPTTPTTTSGNNTPATISSTTSTQVGETSAKPAKITQENRSRSTSESSNSPVKTNRLSVDSKIGSTEKDKDKQHASSHHRTNSESKHKDRRASIEPKTKRNSIDEKTHKNPDKVNSEHRKSTEHKASAMHSSHHLSTSVSSASSIGPMSVADMNDIMINEAKSFPMEVAPEATTPASQPLDQNNMMDSGSLELDQSLLDNLNNDLISEDILYQVAQSLVSNTELQNAIDKSINEGNLVLDPAIQQAMQDQSAATSHSEPPSVQRQVSTDTTHKGTQIVRPDGRIVVIPPIERPTTRSRNKKKEDEKPVFKPTHKPLDDEHVSGNELDSSGDEDESEDDPNKLWCICNQPHNNRFMICCDTCEEWYHGKCVNITKTMGQQMEAEGKEWICLFCKDASLKRPQAAARRVRKASRASRASSDSTSSSKKGSSDGGSSTSIACIVCQKPARKNSIFCSESCILTHAQGVEKVVVFERATGTMLTGNKAPTAANLDQWLREHPGFEVVRSTGKVVTAKSPQLTQSKLKLVKNAHNEGVSLAVQKKGVSVGVLKHAPKNQHGQHGSQQTPGKLHGKGQITGVKIISKNIKPKATQQKMTKLVQAQPMPVAPKPSSAEPTSAPKPSKITKTAAKSQPNDKKAPPSKEKSTVTPTKEKTVPVKAPKARQVETTPPPPKPQENIRENVQKTLFEQLTNRLKMVDDLKLSEDELKNISNEIESQLYKCFGDTGQKYRNKYRSLIFNIKDVKNQTLWRRICEKAVNPYQLVRLSPDDLASQELALWREREAKHQLDMIKKSELELLNCNRQYVLKTHKGEQILEDSRPNDHIENTEVITSLTEGPKPEPGESKHETRDRDKRSNSKHRHKDKDKDREREHKVGKEKAADSREHRHSRRSSSRERDREHSRKRSRSRGRSSRLGKKRSRSRDRDRHRRSSHRSSKHKKESHGLNSTTDKLDKKSKEILEQLVDSKIVPPLEDRLWKHVPQDDIIPASMESDSDHEPSSTVTIPTPPRSSDQDDFSGNLGLDAKKDDSQEERSTSPPLRRSLEEIWSGTISMIDVAQICITAHEVSGDCSGLGTELPPNLDIVGRISPETVWDYIGKMRCSNSKIISLVRLNAINIEEKMPYLALYSYLSSRNRLGVVKSTNKAVKDFYILPLASQKPIPQALLPINGPGFEESRPALLLGIIVRDKRKRPVSEPAPVPATTTKRVRVETPPLPPQMTTRSYTPPPNKDRMKLPLPPVLPAVASTMDDTVKGDDDEPYSPEDSDPDSSAVAPDIPVPPVVPPPKYVGSSTPPQPFPSYGPKIDPLPGLDVAAALPASTKDLESHLAEIDKKIAESKSEINSISQNLASTDIGSSALASIALPSNLQQILDSIKTIVPTGEGDTQAAPSEPQKASTEGNLTIPLMLPGKFSRPLGAAPTIDLTSDIPLKLPKSRKSSRVNSPSVTDVEKPGSVLSSLSEEELIRKAAEMLGEDATVAKKSDTSDSRYSSPAGSSPSASLDLTPARPTIVKTLQPDAAPSKKTRMDMTHPAIPGLDSEML